MLGEFRTSKLCPGGCGGEIVDVQEGVRIRRCNNETAIEGLNPTGACPLFDHSLAGPGVAFTSDRNESAMVNMQLCVTCCLDDVGWPQHLRRSGGVGQVSSGGGGPGGGLCGLQ
ncbi:unnamed protein product, partial [Phaeothamnion confervicola]